MERKVAKEPSFVQYAPPRRISRGFGSDLVFRDVQRAHNTLLRGNHREVASYLRAETNKLIEWRIMRSRLRKEDNRSQRSDKQIRMHWGEMDRWDDRAVKGLVEIDITRVLATSGTPQASVDELNRHLNDFLQAAKQACRSAIELSRLLTSTCTDLQFLLLALVRQDRSTRESCPKDPSSTKLFTRVDDGLLERAALGAWRRPVLLLASWRYQVERYLGPPQLDDVMRQDVGRLESMVNDVRPKMASTYRALAEVQLLLQACMERGPLNTRALPFNLLTAATVQSPQYLRALALRRVSEMTPNDPARTAVTDWQRILECVT